MTDLISREAAIAWHIERRDEAKANADRCRSTDEETACRYLEEAILHGDAINAFRALPAQAPAVKSGIPHDTPITEVATWLLDQASRDYRQHEVDALRAAAAFLIAAFEKVEAQGDPA